MKNRRLLTILIVFIVLGTFAILGGVLFRVRTVKIEFRNEFDFFAAEGAEALAGRLRQSIVDDGIMGRNIIFGINRKNLVKVIETEENRVRVTNIKAVFPNSLEITVRERYPVYKLGIDDQTAILCGNLRVLTTVDMPVEDVNRDNLRTRWDLINITGQVGIPVLQLSELDVGADLTNLEVENSQVQILKELAPFFTQLNSFEDAICNIFESIKFDDVGGGLRLIMDSRPASPMLTHHRNTFELIVWDAELRLSSKLIKSWQAVNFSHTKPGVYQAFDKDSIFIDGTRVEVQDGILVTFRAFG